MCGIAIVRHQPRDFVDAHISKFLVERGGNTLKNNSPVSPEMLTQPLVEYGREEKMGGIAAELHTLLNGQASDSAMRLRNSGRLA